MVLNTTSGPREVPRGHVVNTSRILEEDLVHEDEGPEITHVLPAGVWRAELESGETIPLVAFAVFDDASVHGVAVRTDGSINLLDSVEDHPGFSGYVQENDLMQTKGSN